MSSPALADRVEDLSMLYDLRDKASLSRAYQDRALWGWRYTDAQALDSNTLVLSFRPSLDPRWQGWEQTRRKWILEGAS